MSPDQPLDFPFVKINKNLFLVLRLVFHNLLFFSLRPLQRSQSCSGGPGAAPGRGVQGRILVSAGTKESPDLELPPCSWVALG